jgi:hypothetical protein
LNLPAYVHGYRDRYGMMRFRFRHPMGQRMLPGPAWSTPFMDAYETAMAAATDAKTAVTTIGVDRAKPGSTRAVMNLYLADPIARDGLDAATWTKRRRILERFAAAHADKRLDNLRADQFQALVDKLSPHNQRGWLQALRPFFKWCLRRNFVTATAYDELMDEDLPDPEAMLADRSYDTATPSVTISRSVAPKPSSPPRRTARSRYPSRRRPMLCPTGSSASSTRSRIHAAWRPATTNSRPASAGSSRSLQSEIWIRFVHAA